MTIKTEVKVLKITVQEYARVEGKRERTVREWCRMGKVEAEKDAGGRDWKIIIRRPKE